MIRFLDDNALIKLEPLTENRGHITIIRNRQNLEMRWARVVAVGPGHRTEPTFLSPQGVFIPMELQAGMMVLVDAVAGHDYKLDLSVPRQNTNTDFPEMFGERGEYRVIRGDEALGRRVPGLTGRGGAYALEALGRFVIVKREEQKQVLGRFVVPDNVEEKSLVGEVWSVGRGRALRDGSFRAPDVKPGQRVLFGQFTGIKLDDATGVPGLLLLRDDDVIGVYEDEAAA
jgi:chaperonin GroES